jgi:hypothetical protein
MSRLLRLLLALFVAVVGGVAIDAGSTYVYDASAIASADVRHVSAAETDEAPFGDVREGSVSPAVEGRGTSTTPLTPLVATNTASLSGRTVFGESWDDAIRAARGAVPEAGFHDVIAHGTPTGIYDAAGNLLSPAQAASVIRSTPSWAGQNIRLLSCSTGCPSGTFAQGLADELGVAVRAPTVDFYVNSRGVPVLDPGGSWISYLPGGG